MRSSVRLLQLENFKLQDIMWSILHISDSDTKIHCEVKADSSLQVFEILQIHEYQQSYIYIIFKTDDGVRKK